MWSRLIYCYLFEADSKASGMDGYIYGKIHFRYKHHLLTFFECYRSWKWFTSPTVTNRAHLSSARLKQHTVFSASTKMDLIFHFCNKEFKFQWVFMQRITYNRTQTTSLFLVGKLAALQLYQKA